MSAAPMSWAEAVAAFEQHLCNRGRSEPTVATYASALRVFAAFYQQGLQKPGPFVSRLQETDLQAFIDHLRRDRGLRTASINRFVVALHGFSQFAMQQRWGKRDLARDLKTYHLPPPQEPTRLSPAEVRRLVTSVDLNGRNGHRDLAIVQLLLQTGIRIGELAALSVGDVALNKRDGSVRIQAERTDAERVVPLNTAARRALQDYLNSRGEPLATEPLFLSERRQRMRIVTIQHRVKKYLSCAGREDLSADDLRQHFATQLYEKTGKLTAVQQALGHRSVVTTARYARATRQEIEEAVEGLPGNLALTEATD